MFGTQVEFFWVGGSCASSVHLLPFEPNLRGGRTSSCKILNEYRPVSGMHYLIHFHESSFAGIWERIMREE